MKQIIKNYIDMKINNGPHISVDMIADESHENLMLSTKIFVAETGKVLSETELPVYVFNGKPELFFDEGDEYHACFDSIDAMIYRKGKQAYAGLGTDEITAEIMLTGLNVGFF